MYISFSPPLIRPATPRAAGVWREQPAERTYYRVVTADHQVFELYHEAVSGAWVLDTCQD